MFFDTFTEIYSNLTMKKITLLILFFATTISIAQEKEGGYLQDINKKHEVKINALTLLSV